MEFSRSRLFKILNIQGNDVEAFMKWYQFEPAWSQEIYTMEWELKNKNHGIITCVKCPSLEYFERKGDGRELYVCPMEAKMFKEIVKAFNPNLEVTNLKLPPRESKEEIACKWELKLVQE
jgi:hypothetical protein